MRRPTPTPERFARPLGFLLFAALLVVALPAYAQTIKVTSAVPSETEQGTLGVVVTIGGENFASGAKVNFYVSGTTNPGGIAVKNVKYKSSTALEATIDVALDALVAPFDVQVRCNGRTGKGTELFKVLVKQTGNQSIPPGTVTDLQVASAGDNSVLLTYTLPADDGYDPGTGPVSWFAMRVRTCGEHTELLWAGTTSEDPCLVWANSGNVTGAPGTTVTEGPRHLAPNTDYWVMVRTRDDTQPDGTWSLLAEDLLNQKWFRTGSSPATLWSTEFVDACPPLTSWPQCSITWQPRFDFDRDGNPAILYKKAGSKLLAKWSGSAWQIDPLGTADGSESLDFAFDPTNVATYARTGPTGSKWDLRFFRRTGATSQPWQTEVVATGIWAGYATSTFLAFNPVDGTPAVTYKYAKGNTQTLRLAERHGSSWTSQDVTSGGSIFVGGLGFDPAGNPAVLFSPDVEGEPALLIFAFRENGAWKLEAVAAASVPGEMIGYRVVAFDPLRQDFAVAFRLQATECCANQVHYCERSSGTWACEVLEESWLANGVDLKIGGDGTVYVASDGGSAQFVLIRRPGSSWTREYVGWEARATLYLDLRLAPDGRLGMALMGRHDASGAGFTDSLKFAVRPALAP